MSNQIKCDQSYSTDLTIYEKFLLGCSALRRLRQVQNSEFQPGYRVRPRVKTTKQEEAAPAQNQPFGPQQTGHIAYSKHSTSLSEQI